ncbi:glycosyltransferase [Mesorhizobium sp. ESP7-2]|uniref:glycosyltransferase n=1 Tax=Mesorhizobium sp. ESP7-2 TaxID=2876622 RepID=UPI001CCD7DCF|nr:glycosyltransferase [Mesorhizobium sp. ESP7-2]MBZ9706080.1 glycosyltransferase [Mesorhizobium sp. ESP7-2]
MRFHVIGLPHTHVTDAFSSCAFTNKVANFCRMMKGRGHTVFLYAGEQNTAPCDEHIVCIDEATRAAHVGVGHYTAPAWDIASPAWRMFNGNAAAAIRQRAEKTDFVCVIGGLAHKPIADALPDMLTVEFGVGYGGTFAQFRVFESHAWRHMHYGAASGGDPCAADGRWFDTVIPGYLEPEKFPFSDDKDDYCLYVGRLIDRKGYKIAQDVCEDMGVRLILAGPGAHTGYGEYAGVVGPEERGRLMAGARAVFVPTIYVEPFGNVAVEAMACGTPVLSTDWGAMTETVIDGVTGFRCCTFGEFRRGVENAPTLDPQTIRDHAVSNYSLDVVGAKYERYFERLTHLFSGGWYEGCLTRR